MLKTTTKILAVSMTAKINTVHTYMVAFFIYRPVLHQVMMTQIAKQAINLQKLAGGWESPFTYSEISLDPWRKDVNRAQGTLIIHIQLHWHKKVHYRRMVQTISSFFFSPCSCTKQSHFQLFFFFLFRSVSKP